MKLIASFSVIFFAVSCGKKEEAKKNTASVLEGTWVKACKTSADSEPSTSSKDQVVVSGNSIVYSSNIYLDASCQAGQEYFSVRVIANFTIGSAATTPVDATNFDISSIKDFITYKTADLVKAANDSSSYGKTDWALNVEKEITGLNDDGTASTEPSSHYDIFKITGTTLCFGKDSATNDGTAEKRPTEIDTDDCYTKQ